MYLQLSFRIAAPIVGVFFPSFTVVNTRHKSRVRHNRVDGQIFGIWRLKRITRSGFIFYPSSYIGIHMPSYSCSNTVCYRIGFVLFTHPRQRYLKMKWKSVGLLVVSGCLALVQAGGSPRPFASRVNQFQACGARFKYSRMSCIVRTTIQLRGGTADQSESDHSDIEIKVRI